MIKRFKREDGIGLEYAQNNRFIVRFDEAIEFPEWNVAKFVYNRDGTFTILVMDYVLIDTDEGLKYSTESYFTEKMKNAGNRSLTLEVRASNGPAAALYEKLGFLQVGCRSNYYRNPKEDAYILRKEWEV